MIMMHGHTNLKYRKGIVRQVGDLQELCLDARSTENKILAAWCTLCRNHVKSTSITCDNVRITRHFIQVSVLTKTKIPSLKRVSLCVLNCQGSFVL
jgi:hypothetical protein